MKLLGHSTGAVATGMPSPKQLTIQRSPKIFAILSGLYSDTPTAILRELGANASDSLEDAGKAGTPFTVRLPTTIEPSLSISDEGTGLSPSQIAIVYTEYGASDKVDSNRFIGGLGLGSKSPFAYAGGNFAVVSRHGGMRYTYSLFKDSEGFPSYSLVDSCPDDSGTGVEVMIPIAAADFQAFYSAAARAYRFFPVRPLFLGKVPTFATNDYVIRTARYGLFKPNPSQRTSSMAIMGGIGYKLDTTALCGPGSDAYQPQGFREALLAHGVHLFLGIGDADVVPSREALSYTPATLANVCAALDAVRDDVVAEVQAEISACPTLWDARLASQRFRQKNLFKFLNADVQKTVRWRGVEASPRIAPPPGCDAIPLLTWSKSNFRRDSSFAWRRAATEKVRNIEALRLVVLDDVGTGAYAGAVRWFENDIYTTGTFAIFLPGDTSEEFIASAGFGHLVVRASALPKVVRAAISPRAQKPKTLVRRWCGLYSNGNENYAIDSFWQAEEGIDLAAGGVYVEMNSNRISWPENDRPGKTRVFLHPARIKATVRALVDMERMTTPIYGVRTADLPRLAKAGKWVELRDYATAQVKAYTRRLTAVSQRLEAARQYESWAFRHSSMCEQRFAAKSPYGDFVRVLRRHRDDADMGKQVAAFDALRLMYLGLAADPDKDEIAAYKLFVATYPLLHAITFDREQSERGPDGNYTSVPVGPQRADIRTYVDLIDRDRASRGKQRPVAAGAPEAPATAPAADDETIPDAQAVA